jgi:hypothetical protein
MGRKQKAAIEGPTLRYRDLLPEGAGFNETSRQTLLHRIEVSQ